MGKLSDKLQALLEPAPELDPEDVDGFDDGTRAASGQRGSDDDDDDDYEVTTYPEPAVVPRRRLHDDEDDDDGESGELVKSSRAELFGDACVIDDGSDEEQGDDDDDEEQDEEEEDLEEEFEEEEEERGPRSRRQSGPVQETDVAAGDDLDSILRGLEEEDASGAMVLAAEAPRRAREGEVARQYLALHGKVMELRVQMQALTALAKRTGGNDDQRATAALSKTAEAMLRLAKATTSVKEEEEQEEDVESLWSRIEAARELRRPGWERTLESWRRRTHLGAATKHLKSINNLGPFAQARASLTDVARCQRKMHPQRQDGSYDLEQYDDADLYGAQLRDYLEAAGTIENSKRALDEDNLNGRKKARKSTTTDRAKASKGRRLKYETHEKLTNFMFPVPAPAASVDVDMLMRSLFKGGSNGPQASF